MRGCGQREGTGGAGARQKTGERRGAEREEGGGQEPPPQTEKGIQP